MCRWRIIEIPHSYLTDEHFTEMERKWIQRLQYFIELYLKMFLVTGIVYITSPNIFALIKYSLNYNTTLLPETAKIEYGEDLYSSHPS